MPATLQKAEVQCPCSRCGQWRETESYLRKDIGWRDYCAECAGFLQAEFDGPTAPPPCNWCGEALPLFWFFTNGKGWAQFCDDCGAVLTGDLSDEDDDPTPTAAPPLPQISKQKAAR